MKEYNKPELLEEEIELEDVVASSVENNTDDGIMSSITSFFSKGE